MKTSTCHISASLFLRFLGVIYFMAFSSLSVQAVGLWGENGILPLARYSRALWSHYGISVFCYFPSLFYFFDSDLAIRALTYGGSICGLVIAAGFLQGPLLLICFLLYLSFCTSGQVFMSFQWDALLLETGFLALFLASWGWKKQTLAVDRILRYTLYALIFKLMFLSGVVKLFSGDPSWSGLTALTYHFWSQPLPNVFSVLMNALPKWVLEICTFVVLVIEIGFPVLIFYQRTRRLAAFGFLALSVMILFTGNYAFFNWLTIALTLPLIDDKFWKTRFPKISVRKKPLEKSKWRKKLELALLAPLLAASVLWCCIWVLPPALHDVSMVALRPLARFHISNSYGLFANMTKQRDEIVVEGSDDGKEWKEYEFRYKPGTLDRRPAWVAPHQPRLDWQMWFAALGKFEQNPWLGHFILKLFMASPEVLGLLETNPFPKYPPLYIRCRIYSYTMNSPGEVYQSGQWWKRSEPEDYTGTFQR